MYLLNQIYFTLQIKKLNLSMHMRDTVGKFVEQNGAGEIIISQLQKMNGFDLVGKHRC